MWELTKSFTFEAAHTLRREIDREASRRIHGHYYKAEIAVSGRPDRGTGMIVDIGVLEQHLGGLRAQLDHQFLDDIEDMGPATMENIARWIWDRAVNVVPGLVRVTVLRESCGERCAYEGRAADA
ncbi:MAG TPA: 6-carboxytetrahydropterin synthase [Rhizomicrobium sp.]